MQSRLSVQRRGQLDCSCRAIGRSATKRMQQCWSVGETTRYLAPWKEGGSPPDTGDGRWRPSTQKKGMQLAKVGADAPTAPLGDGPAAVSGEGAVSCWVAWLLLLLLMDGACPSPGPPASKCGGGRLGRLLLHQAGMGRCWFAAADAV